MTTTDFSSHNNAEAEQKDQNAKKTRFVDALLHCAFQSLCRIERKSWSWSGSSGGLSEGNNLVAEWHRSFRCES